MWRIWRATFVFVILSCTITPGFAEQALADRFQAARIVRSAGDLNVAIPELRAVLREVPDDIRVREELGYALLLDKQYAAAQFHFEQLLARVRDPNLQVLYRAVLRRIAIERPFGFGLVFEVAPSSNLNGGSALDGFDTVVGTLNITPQSQAQSGRRVTLGLNGFAQRPIGDRDVARLDWLIKRNTYDIDALEDSTEVFAQLSWQRQWARGQTSFGLGWGREKAKSEERDFQQARLRGFWPLGQRGFVETALTYTRNRYDTRPSRDGHDILADLRFGRYVRQAGVIWAGLQLERARPAAEFQQYDGTILQLGGQVSFAGGLQMQAVLSEGKRDFAAPFPLRRDARADRFTELSISIQSSRLNWQGLTPKVTCRLRDNRSNVGLFESNAQECGFVLTRRF